MYRTLLGLLGLVLFVSFAKADPAGTRMSIAAIDKMGREITKLKQDDELNLKIRVSALPPIDFLMKKNGKRKDVTIGFDQHLTLRIGILVVHMIVPTECIDRSADGTIDSCRERTSDNKWKQLSRKDSANRFQVPYEGMIMALEQVAAQSLENAATQKTLGEGI